MLKIELKKIELILLTLVMTSFFGIVSQAEAGVNLPWSTTYDCPDWTAYNQSLNCDGLDKGLDSTTANGHQEEILSIGNNPNGGGGKGQIHYMDNGVNNNTGGTAIYFNTPTKELWVRWYMKYQQGFKWNPLHYDKYLYFYMVESDGSSSSQVIVEPDNMDSYRIYAQVADHSYRSENGTGWTHTMGGTTGDGQWHYYEVHLKAENGGDNGVVEFYVDGTKIIDRTDANFATGTQLGWGHITIGSNQDNPDNGGTMYSMYDDISISTTGYIGPLSSSTVRADVDQDNQITSTDAMLTLRKSLNLDMSQTNWQDSPTTGDVNCDDDSNSTDAMLILRKSLGLDMSGTGWCID